MNIAASLDRYRLTLRYPDLRRMLAAFTILEIGAWSYSIVLAAWIFAESGSVAGIAAVASVRWITGTLVTSFAGVAADRFERRRLLTVCSLILCALMLAMAVAVGMGAPIWIIVGLSALNAIVESPNRSAAGALVPEVVDESNLVTANVMINLLGNLVLICGPLLGGLLVLLGNPVVAVGLNAATYACAGVLYSRISIRSVGDVQEQGDSALTQWRTGLSAVIHRPYVLALTLCVMTSTAIDSSYTVVFAKLTQHLGTGESGYGLFFAASAGGGILMAVVANQMAERGNLGYVVGLSLVLQGVPLALIGVTNSLWLVLVLLAIAGAGTVMVDVLAITALQRAVPNRLLGRVLGIMTAMSLLGASLSIIALGWSIEHVGLEVSIIVSGVVLPTVGIFLLPLLRRGSTEAALVTDDFQARAAFIEQLGLFDGLGRPGIESLALAAESVTLPAGHVLMQQGEPATDLWLLESGRLAIDIQGQDTPPPPVFASGWVGELGLLNGTSRSATVTLSEESRLLRVDGQQFLAAIAMAAPSQALLRIVADRSRRSQSVSALTPTAVPSFSLGA